VERRAKIARKNFILAVCILNFKVEMDFGSEIEIEIGYCVMDRRLRARNRGGCVSFISKIDTSKYYVVEPRSEDSNSLGQ